MKRSTLTFFGFLSGMILLALTYMAPNDEIIKALLDYHQAFVQEKVYVQTDKSIYSQGEDIWFKVYLLNGASHKPNALSKLIYVQLINPLAEIVENRNIQINQGGGLGDFKLKEDWQPGIYQIRAYSNYQQNFEEALIFKKYITVVGIEEVTSTTQIPRNSISTEPKKEKKISMADIEVSFYPEGGELVAGIAGVVAIEARTKSGQGIALKGSIFDQQGNTVTVWKTLYNGYGITSFTPKPGFTYVAKIAGGNQIKQIDLPVILQKGFGLNIKQRNQQLEIALRRSQDQDLQGCYLLVHARGIPSFSYVVQENKNSVKVVVPQKEFPEGVNHFTLFDENGIPQSERLIFIKPIWDLPFNWELDKSTVSTRERVNLSIQTPYQEDTLSFANLNLRILDSSVLPDDSLANIQTYFLLSSDLPEIPSIATSAMIKGDYQSAVILDYLMMTKGWRRFEWANILQNKKPQIKYFIEKGFTVAGKVTRHKKEDKVTQAEVFINSLDGFFFMDQTTTTDYGRFSFNNLIIQDTTTIVIQGNRGKDKKPSSEAIGPEGNRFVDIQVDRQEFADVNYKPFSKDITVDSLTLGDYVAEGMRMKVIRRAFDTMFIDFDEVIISASRIEADPIRESGLAKYRRPTHRFVMDSVPGALYAGNIFDILQARVPGLKVIQGDGFIPEVFFVTSLSLSAGNVAPLFVVDGIITDISHVMSLNTSDIYAVDVLKRGDAAIFGSRAYGGVIAVYTRTGTGVEAEEKLDRYGIIDFKHPGYYQARTFYSPRYDKPKAEDFITDYRTTLFWEPAIYLKDNNVDISFYTSDKSGTFDIYLEGITHDGKIIYQKKKLVVE